MDTVDTLIAREHIRDRLHHYCNGIDRRDWAMVRACFADDHVHSHGGFTGSADAFIAFASEVLRTIPATHHSISNVIITFSEDGKNATTQANFVAYHRIEAGHHEGTPVPTGGKATDWTVAGRYCDQMERRDGAWLIVKRDAVHDWERVEAVHV